jgi:hypothetical protein
MTTHPCCVDGRSDTRHAESKLEQQAAKQGGAFIGGDPCAQRRRVGADVALAVAEVAAPINR